MSRSPGAFLPAYAVRIHYLDGSVRDHLFETQHGLMFQLRTSADDELIHRVDIFRLKAEKGLPEKEGGN